MIRCSASPLSRTASRRRFSWPGSSRSNGIAAHNKKIVKSKATPLDVAEHLATPQGMAAYLDAWFDEAPDDVAIARASDAEPLSPCEWRQDDPPWGARPTILRIAVPIGTTMADVKSIEDAVKALPPHDLAKFRRWFADFDFAVWDAQIEADTTAGKLDTLLQEAAEDYAQGERRGV